MYICARECRVGCLWPCCVRAYAIKKKSSILEIESSNNGGGEVPPLSRRLRPHRDSPTSSRGFLKRVEFLSMLFLVLISCPTYTEVRFRFGEAHPVPKERAVDCQDSWKKHVVWVSMLIAYRKRVLPSNSHNSRETQAGDWWTLNLKSGVWNWS